MKIFLDYDNTLNNLLYDQLFWIKEKYGETVLAKEVICYDFLGTRFEGCEEYWRYPTCYDRCVPLDGAQDFVKKLVKSFGSENVSIISASVVDCIPRKNRHIKDFFPEISQNNIIHTHHKEFFTERGILIDDYPEHINKHIKKNDLPGILFNHLGNYGWCKDIQNEKALICTDYDSILEKIYEIQENYHPYI